MGKWNGGMLEGWVLKGYELFFNLVVNKNFTTNPTLHDSIIPLFQSG
jgi:hypothetical protein